MKLALKEWNTTIEALGKGLITAVWRKGGIEDTPSIWEKNTTFEVPDKKFILLPTFTHQNLDKIKKDFWPLFNQNHRLNKDSQVLIKYWAELEKEIEIETLDELLNISSQLINSNEHLIKTWETSPLHKGKILILKIFELANPVLITNSFENGGCKSWAQIKVEIPEAKSKRVLRLKELNKKVRFIQALLKQKEQIMVRL